MTDDTLPTTYLTDMAEFLDCLETCMAYKVGDVEITLFLARKAWKICMRLADRFEMYNLRTWLEENYPYI
jgi:hypothetical protein